MRRADRETTTSTQTQSQGDGYNGVASQEMVIEKADWMARLHAARVDKQDMNALAGPLHGASLSAPLPAVTQLGLKVKPLKLSQLHVSDCRKTQSMKLSHLGLDLNALAGPRHAVALVMPAVAVTFGVLSHGIK
jgi:hypothetical protein